MSGVRMGLAWLVVSAAIAVPAAAQFIDCVGADGPYRLPEAVSCSQAVPPQNAARVFLETALDASPSLSAVGLAALLEDEASRTCVQLPERGTLGMLYGVGRWGCEGGYAYRNLCDGFYLRKEVAAEYGTFIVYDVVVSSSGWNVLAIDSDFRTLTRAATGDTRISVILSLRPGLQAGVPDGYADTLRAQVAGQAKTVMREIIAYCTTYKEERCTALRALAAQLTSPATPTATPTALSLAATADKHLATEVSLGLSSDQVLLVVVTGVVADDRGRSVASAEVKIAGTTMSAPSTPDGVYRVSFFGTGTALVTRRVNITIERAAVDVSLKTPSDGMNVLGVAADGVSRLVFTVTNHGIRPESVIALPPTLGHYERVSSAASPLAFDKDGNATLTYVPPDSLPDEALTTTVTVGTGPAARSVAAAPVSIAVRYVDPDGATQTTTLPIKVCRPPALLVQSFLGGPATWAAFADFARSRRLDCQVVGEGVTWGLGNASLADWAKELARNVSDAKASYSSAGIKTSAVDIVAHSSSGLVARSLVEGSDGRGSVRRLVLVGTPNHGIAWLDQEAAATAAQWLAAHPTAAAELREGSPFVRQLSASVSGDRETDYVNVVGRRTPRLSASQQGSSTVQDDGIVSAASSHLDSVPEIRLDGVVHAPGLPVGGTGLTESPAVWARLVDLLVGEALRAEPDALRIELRRGKQVSASVDPQTAPWLQVSRFPFAVPGGVGLRTGDKGYGAIAITRGGETWGSISLDAKTEVVLLASSPDLLRMEVISGQARLRASGDDAGDFEVVLDPLPRGTLWYATQPEVRTVAVKGDYVVAREETSSVIALGGTVMAEYAKGTGFLPPRWVEAGTGVQARPNGTIEDETIPARGWWASGVWRETLPAFRVPFWLMTVMLVGLAAAIAYHVRARAKHERKAGSPSP